MESGASKMDIQKNRHARKWTRIELARRALWEICQPLFRFSPRLLWEWRCFLLRMFGAKIGKHVHIHPSVRIFIPWNLQIGDWSSVGFDALIYNLGFVDIGTKTTISQRAHLCAGTHDFRDASMPLVKPPISIGDEAWICADAFIGPGVKVGFRSVVGACAVAMKEIPDNTVVGGNPAKALTLRNL